MPKELLDLARGGPCLDCIGLRASDDPSNIQVARLMDSHVEVLADLLPDLQELTLGIAANLTSQSLLSLSVHYPNLHIIALGGGF